MKGLYFFFIAIAFASGEDFLPSSTIDKLNDFYIELFEELIQSSQENLVLSAFSVRNILALTSLGARGDTAKQLKTSLKLDGSDDQIKEEFNKLALNFKGIKYLNIETANKAYLADGLDIVPEFKKTAEYFDAGVENVNFNDPKETTKKINSWVEKRTHNKIKNLLQEGNISALTRFILVNTLYFQGNFLHPFENGATEKKDFYISKTETVPVDMMKMSANILIGRNSALGASMISLPYQNKKAQLVIFIPDDIEKTEEMQRNIGEIWHNRNLTYDYVKVFLPKFRVESTINMIPALKNMGVTELFSKPDLTGITKEEVVVSAVTQKTYIDVNELGTEAASATAVEGITRALPSPRENPQVFNVNRPFVYAITYDGLGLLAGRVNKL